MNRLLWGGLTVAGSVLLTLTLSDPSRWPLAVLVIYGLAGVTLAAWWTNRLSMATVLVVAVVCRVILFPLLPGLSDDAYRYIWDGWIQLKGINPYAFLPEEAVFADLQTGTLYAELNSKAYYTVYPPASQLVFAFGGLFREAGWQASYFAIKTVLVLVELGALFLLSRMVSAGALVLYAWNPLVLIETAGQAHTEALMVLGLMVSVWSIRHQRSNLAMLGFSLAAWVKLYPVVLLPFVVRRTGWKALWVFGLVSVGLAAPYYAPYVLDHVRSSLDLYVRLFEFNAGPYELVKAALTAYTGQDWWGTQGWGKIIGPIFRDLFLLSLPIVWVLDWRYDWSLPRVVGIVFGAYLFFSTTIHPWYFLGLLAMVPFLRRPPWHWLWLSTVLMGTYLFYTLGLRGEFVMTGWLGWLVLAVVGSSRPVRATAAEELLRLQRFRARGKVRFIRSMFPASLQAKRVLDLGAAEGYVGEVLKDEGAEEVVLVDVLDLNRTTLPLVQYDGRTLPFERDAFDITILYFVLHHAEDPEQVVREALRVTRETVVVVESVYETEWNRRVLRVLDTLSNRLRSAGLMREQEEFLNFRRIPEWMALFVRNGATVHIVRQRGQWLHQQAAFKLTRT